MPSESSKALQRWLLFAVVGFGLLLRGWDLGEPSFWPDEAESSINALTIVEHGVPTDSYLGIPIYENMLTKAWPEHAEYEFKDVSYTDRGFPVYHGWLPLYSIAAALFVAGIEPDNGRPINDPRLDEDEYRFRTIVPRIPALLYSALFMLFVFAGGKALAGPSAGWTSLLAASCSAAFVVSGRQARYYAPTLAMSAATFYAIISITKKGRWRDYVGGAIAFSLLFHTHLLSTAAVAVVFCLTVPRQLRHPRIVAKLAVFALITSSATVPWMIWVGFFEHFGQFPPARHYLAFPDDYLVYLMNNREYVILFALPVVWLTVLKFLRRDLPTRLTRPFLAHQRAFVLLTLWGLIAYSAFLLFIPLASYFTTRLTLTVQTASVLLLGVTFACISRAVLGRSSTILSCGLALVFLFGVARQKIVDYSTRWNFESLQVASVLKEVPLGDGVRLYATPNDHLVLTYYTGLPFQSVAPVRKEFLDNYPGGVFLVREGRERVLPADPLGRDSVEQASRDAGMPLSMAELDSFEAHLRTRIAREDLRGKVANIVPPLQDLPGYLTRLTREQRELDAERASKFVERPNQHPAMRGMNLRKYSDWWQIFFYRLVDPASRRGDRVNFADRLKSSTAYVFPGVAWNACYAPPLE